MVLQYYEDCDMIYIKVIMFFYRQTKLNNIKSYVLGYALYHIVSDQVYTGISKYINDN